MNAAARELAWQNARILAMLPIEQWLDELQVHDLREYHEDWKLRKVLRAMLEVKRTVEGIEGKR